MQHWSQEGETTLKIYIFIYCLGHLFEAVTFQSDASSWMFMSACKHLEKLISLHSTFLPRFYYKITKNIKLFPQLWAILSLSQEVVKFEIPNSKCRLMGSKENIWFDIYIKG